VNELPQSTLSAASSALIAQLQQQLKAKDEQFEAQAEQLNRQQQVLQSQTRELDYARLKIRALEERLRRDRIARYGKRSETLSDLQLELLDLEPGVSSEEVAAEGEREALTTPSEDKPQDHHKTKVGRKHPGRQTLPGHLARVEKIIACTAEQCRCGQCGEATTVIGYEETEVLDVKPAEYFVTVLKREKRACKSCAEQGVETAAAPERIVPKSLFSDQVIIDFVVAKYADSLPVYRQSSRLKRDAGLDVHRSTICDAVMRVGELLLPIAGAMKRELLEGSYIQADETPVGVQTHDKRGRNHLGYLWQYGSPGKGVVFDFRMGRDREGPKQFLGNFEGLLQTDGYQAYNKVGGPGMVHACCLAHARRKFVEAVKVDAKDQDSARIVALMDELFAIDRAARDQNMDHAQRDALRQERAPHVLEQLRTRLLALQKTVLPKSLAGQAANYTLSLWSKLTRFLDNPELELSNNLAENSMRPVAIGRRNWLHLGSKEAGPKVAAIFSVIESCRRLSIPVREYLASVLPGLANRSIQSVAQLTPTAYAASK
jgi:transposase